MAEEAKREAAAKEEGKSGAKFRRSYFNDQSEGEQDDIILRGFESKIPSNSDRTKALRPYKPKKS